MKRLWRALSSRLSWRVLGVPMTRNVYPAAEPDAFEATHVLEQPDQTDGAGRDGMLRLLDRCDVVEFAEPEARRKLARSA